MAQSKGIKTDTFIDELVADDGNKELKEYMLKVSLVQNYIKNLILNTSKLNLYKLELSNSFAEKEKGLIIYFIFRIFSDYRTVDR
jgi:hypothetical protein